MSLASARKISRDSRTARVASRLHSAAIHLLRRLRLEDSASGLTAPRLSVLSVVVFAGPQTVSALAAAEQVRVPTMTRLVQGLEADGLVSCAQDTKDRRKVIVRATARGEQLLRAGQARRVGALAAQLAKLNDSDMECLDRATTLIEALVRPNDEAR